MWITVSNYHVICIHEFKIETLGLFLYFKPLFMNWLFINKGWIYNIYTHAHTHIYIYYTCTQNIYYMHSGLFEIFLVWVTFMIRKHNNKFAIFYGTNLDLVYFL